LIGFKRVSMLGVRREGLAAAKKSRGRLDRRIQRIVDFEGSARSAGPYNALLGSTIPGAS